MIPEEGQSRFSHYYHKISVPIWTCMVHLCQNVALARLTGLGGLKRQELKGPSYQIKSPMAVFYSNLMWLPPLVSPLHYCLETKWERHNKGLDDGNKSWLVVFFKYLLLILTFFSLCDFCTKDLFLYLQ